MARRYARDNRGRFTSSGTGATARGGRLKTASGKKRATQTMRASSAKPSGAIKGSVKRDPGAAGKIGQGKTRPSKPAPSAATIAQVGRERRATRNLNAAMKREGEGPNSKASRSASVAKRARAIYAGKVDPKAKTGARLTKTTDSEALRKRMKKMKDNNAAKPNASRAAAAKPTTQKERWAARSAMLSNAAAKNEAKAASLFSAANTAGNTAFNTQPGRLAGRARMNAQTERSFKLQEKAEQQRSRAANLQRMATTNKGDAAKGRASKAETVKASHTGLKKGDKIVGTLYGEREVVKVNAKSVTVKGGTKNFTIPWEFIQPRR